MATNRKKQGEGQRSSKGGQRGQSSGESSGQSRGGKRGQSSGESSGQSSEQSRDLKAREYRDQDGKLHHHTHKWMEDHAGGSPASRGGRSTSSRDESEEEE